MKSFSIHMVHGLKTALAAILAYGITEFLHLEFGYWAVISTVIVMQVYVADSVDMCLYRLSGTLIGAALGVAILLVTPRTPAWTGISLFLSVGLCSFLTRYQTRYRMAAITVVIVIMTTTASADIIAFGLSRVAEIGLGILCAFAVSVLIFPRRKADILKKKLENQARACADLSMALVEAFNRRQQHVDEAPVEALVKEVMNNQVFLMNIRRHEARIYRLQDNFSAKVFLMGRAVEHLRTMARILNSLEPDGYEIIMAKELECLADYSGRGLNALMSGERTTGSGFSRQELSRLIQDMDSRLLDIRKEGLIRRFDLKRLVQVVSFYNSFKYFAEDIVSGADRIQASGR